MITRKEIWRDIASWEGKYQVSNRGRVRSMPRQVRYCDGRIRLYPEKILSTPAKRDRYTIVALCHKSEPQYEYVHRLVALAFLEQPKPGEMVNHKDLNKGNNRVDNLEWVTQKENSQHAVECGVNYNPRPMRGSNSVKAKLSESEVVEILVSHASGQKSTKELATQFRVTKQNIRYIVTGKTWTHLERDQTGITHPKG